ncbi:MAG TPA: RimK/LysX family protein [Candidatus Saccharimonadales bacterium]|nr:RimK/LysX family protein [Candidatus Saccharimonadales bacterium]
MDPQKPKKVLGRAEQISFPEIDSPDIYARIDSGARTSALWVSYAEVEDGRLAVTFFGPGHPAYTGEKKYFDAFDKDIVTSSTGHRQQRYKIKLSVVLKKRRIKATFTLADRSTQVYPVLIGRNVLRGKFVVDVTLGKVLRQEEQELRRKNQLELGQENQP